MRKTSSLLVVERLAFLAALPLAGAAVYATARLAIADADYRTNTTESLQRAVSIEPRNAEYHELLADHMEGENRNGDADRQAAIRLSPLDSKYWVDLGFQAETNNKLAEAEKYYLHAASIDRMFVPRWTLMNFYFRRQDGPNFWLWTKRALEMGHDDLSAAYRLCWQMTDDPHQIESVLPADYEIRRNYLFFLVETRRFQYLSPLDHEVAEGASAADYRNMLEYCERTVIGNPRSAVDVWNTLSRKGLVPFGTLDPNGKSIVTDGEFRTMPMERGFDWRLAIVEGAEVSLRPETPGLSVQLTGDQPENCILAVEVIPLTPGRNYKLTYQYSSREASASSGLTWDIRDLEKNAPIAESDTLKLTGDAAGGQTTFNAGTNGAAQLILRYRRESGTVRHEEGAFIRSVKIEALP